MASQYLKVAYRKAREGLLTRAGNDSTRENGFKMKEGRFKLDIRMKFFAVGLERHRNRLLRDAVDALYLEVSQARMDVALTSLV